MSIAKRLLRRAHLFDKMTRMQLEPFLEKHATSARTLAVGCGNGMGAYANYYPNAVALDVVPGPGVDVVGDAHDLRMFADDEFECVLCTEVLEHLHTPATAIAEMRRVLRPGGMLVLTTRFIFPLHQTPHDYYRYTKYGLQHLFRDFEILELREELPTLQTLAVLVQRIGFQTRTRGGKSMRAMWLLVAKLIERMPSVLTAEFGNIEEGREEDAILTSGYYLAARKPAIRESR